MKNVKYLIIFALLIISAGLFSANATIAFKDATTATYNYVLQEDPAYPVSTPTAYKWVVKAYLSSDNVVDPLLTTGEPSVNDLFLVDLRLGFNSSGYLSISSAVVPEATWMGADTWIYLRVFNNATFANATKYMTFFAPYKIIAGGLTNVNIMPLYGWQTTPVWNWIAPVVDTWTYNLTINGPAATVVTGPDAVQHTPLPAVLTDNDDAVNELLGVYTAGPAPAGFHWVVNPITVAETDFTGAKVDHVYNAAITFELAADPDTYLYKLYVNGPDGKAVTGPVPGTTDYIAQNADQSLLLGAYTIGAPDAGYQWTNPTITVDNTGWTLVPPLKGMGARSNGAKVLLTYEKTIEFVQELIPTTYTLNVTGPDGYAVSGPVAGTTDYVATDSDDMINELLGDYTIAAPPAGYTWAAGMITVTADMFVGNVATIEFVLNVIPPTIVVVTEGDVPPGYPQTEVVNAVYMVTWTGTHDLFIPRGPTDTSARAWYNGMWNLPDGSPDWTWTAVDFDAKAPVPVIVFGPTLPVELSSFSAILTAQNFVKLTWVTESETNMNGYNVYRNETADYAAATHIGYQASTNSSTQHVYTHTDNEVETNNTYYYWLECVDFNGTSTLYGPQYVTVVGNDTPNLPTVTTLNNAYPNPFKTSTTIAVDVKEGENATVTIYNILGQAVMTYRVPAGTHNLNWNGRDSKGNACGSGIYFYKLTSPTKNQTKKMVIVK